MKTAKEWGGQRGVVRQRQGGEARVARAEPGGECGNVRERQCAASSKQQAASSRQQAAGGRAELRGHANKKCHERRGHERRSHERRGHERKGHERKGHERKGHEVYGLDDMARHSKTWHGSGGRVQTRRRVRVARTVLLPRLRQRHLGRASRQRRGWPLSLALLGSVRRGSIGPRAAGGAGGCEHPSDDVGVELMALSGEVVVGARELLDPVARHVHIWLVARQHDRILRIVGVCPVAKVVE